MSTQHLITAKKSPSEKHITDVEFSAGIAFLTAQCPAYQKLRETVIDAMTASNLLIKASMSKHDEKHSLQSVPTERLERLREINDIVISAMRGEPRE